MRRVLYVALLVPLFFVPLNRVNVADLLPIEAVAIYMDGDQVVLETDAEYKGAGETAEKALAALKENTPAVVYLDTAEYLLVDPDAVEQAEALRSHLKPSVKVCVCRAAGKVKYTTQYLEVHGDLPCLKDWETKNDKK